MFIRGVMVHVFALNHSVKDVHLRTPLYQKHTVTTLMQSWIKGHSSKYPVVSQHYSQVDFVEAFKFAAELVYISKLHNNE